MMRSLLALLLVAGFAVAAPVPKALKAKVVKMDGDWRIETVESNGQIGPMAASDYTLWRVEGNTMTLICEKNAAAATYACSLVSETPDAGPRSFEYKVHENGYHRRGICELEAETLRIAFSSDTNTPPAELKSSPSVTVYTFKRTDGSK